MDNKKYLSVKEMPQFYPFLTETALRRLIHGNKDGIKKTMIKIGGKIFFDVERFNQWLEEQRLEKED